MKIEIYRIQNRDKQYVRYLQKKSGVKSNIEADLSGKTHMDYKTPERNGKNNPVYPGNEVAAPEIETAAKMKA